MSRPSSSAPRMYFPPAEPHCGPIGIPPNWITGWPFTIFVPPSEMTRILLPCSTTVPPVFVKFSPRCDTCDT